MVKVKILVAVLATALLLTACGHGTPAPRPEFPGSPMMERED